MLREKIYQHLDARRARTARRCHQMHGAFGLLPVLQDRLDFARRNGVPGNEVRQIRDTDS